MWFILNWLEKSGRVLTFHGKDGSLRAKRYYPLFKETTDCSKKEAGRGLFNVHIDQVFRSDFDGMRKHEWSSASIVVFGRCFEETPNRLIPRKSFSVWFRKAGDLFRLILPGNKPCIIISFRGPIIRSKDTK